MAKHIRIKMVRMYQIVDSDTDQVEFETLDHLEAVEVLNDSVKEAAE